MEKLNKIKEYIEIFSFIKFIFYRELGSDVD